MENPWGDLPSEPPYVLPQDKSVVLAANRRKRSNSSPHYLHTNLLPVPFVGNPDADLVVLTANPSLGNGTIEQAMTDEAGPYGIALRSSQTHSVVGDYPFFYVDPAFESFSGASYWKPRLAELPVPSPMVIGSNVLEVEFYAYRSRGFSRSLRVDSQRYSFHLVRRALRRGAVVVGMRARPQWEDAVPELKGHAFWLTSFRKPYLSHKQLPGDAFDAVVRALLGVAPVASR